MYYMCILNLNIAVAWTGLNSVPAITTNLRLRNYVQLEASTHPIANSMNSNPMNSCS